MPTVSMLASVADLAASQAAGAISQLLPSGIILPFGGATPPAGWLFCNGQLVNRTTYSNLFSAIGTVHGSGDGSTTFHLPDLRGRFLRGTDIMSQNAVTTAAGRDPDKAGRLASNAGGNTGDAVGSVQGNATAKNGLGTVTVSGLKNQLNGTTNADNADHGHGWTGRLMTGVGDGSVTSSGRPAIGDKGIGDYGDYGVSTGGRSATHAHPWDFGGSATFSATGASATGDNETRPLNANVNYIIKV